MTNSPPKSRLTARVRSDLTRLACAAVLVLALGISVPAAAEPPPPALRLPLDCAPGQTCWVANYVDTDPGPGARDFACGPRTYDGHKGTDIAIRDEAAMRRGVAVRAASPGTVTALRDGMADIDFRARPAARIEGRDCGNGVVIDHGSGWTTQYCHMRRDSVRVRKGDAVAAGQAVGLVGMSGRSMFPHLHITVRRGKAVIDPFTGRSMAGASAPGGRGKCGARGAGLWSAATARALPYRAAAIIGAGFARAAPDAKAVWRGDIPAARPADRTAPLILWVNIFGVRKGDRIVLTITGPGGGTLFRRNADIAKDQARRFIYAGRKPPPGGWARGNYRGAVELIRTVDPKPAGRIQATAAIRLE